MTTMRSGMPVSGMRGWQLGYDRVVVDRLIATGELDVVEAIARAADTNDRVDDGTDVVRQIVLTVSASAAWTCSIDDARTDVHAEFTCDDEGFLTNDYHLTLSVYLCTGVLIADPGLRRLTDLPGERFETVHDVLDGVTALLNDCVEQAYKAIAHASGNVPLAVQVVSVDDLRSAVAMAEDVGDAEATAIAAASYADVTQALFDVWPRFKERYFAFRREVIGAARRQMASPNIEEPGDEGSDTPAADEPEFFHNIGIGVYGDRFAVTWPGGPTSIVEKSDSGSAELYEALADALDAIELATGCPFHQGDARDSTACDCDAPTIAAGA